MILDTTAFRLADGADQEAFLQADKRVQTEVAYQQRGMLRRTTARSGDGEWLVTVLWDDAANATDLFAAELSPFADAATVRTARYETLD